MHVCSYCISANLYIHPYRDGENVCCLQCGYLGDGHNTQPYMEIVNNRDAVTRFPVIQTHNHPGTVIRSDKWAAYNTVSNAVTGVTRQETVNHSLHFKDTAHKHY